MTPAAAPSPPSRGGSRYVATLALVSFIALGVTLAAAGVDVRATASFWLAQARESPLAGPVAILIFVALITLGTPQFVLITALVAVFGPWLAFTYAWIGKVLSCAIGFYIGRRFGARILAKHARGHVEILINDLARHGFWASALVRLVPTAPSVVVNVAAGSTPMRFIDFIAGAAVGSIPKLALIAFAGDAAIRGLSGAGAGAWLSVAGTLLLLAFLGWIAKRYVQEARQRAKAAHAPKPADSRPLEN